MSSASLVPVFALAFWTFCVLLRIAFVRVGAVLKGRITVDDFRHGESDQVPEHVVLTNRNYMNLLELPVLFYAVSLLLVVTATASPLTLGLQWAYVALRMAHTVIHLTYNHVLHRFAAFATSNVVLLLLWLATALSVYGRT